MSSVLFKIKIEPVDADPVGLSTFEKSFYRQSGKPAFIVGKKFNASFKYSNIGTGPCPSSKIIITIHWPSGQLVNVPIELHNFNPRDEGEFTFENEGILCPGYANFSARLVTDQPVLLINSDGKREEQNIFPVYRDESNIIDPRVSFFYIYAQSAEEFYQYWAMMIAAIGLTYPILWKYLGSFYDWILIYLLFIQIVSGFIEKQ